MTPADLRQRVVEAAEILREAIYLPDVQKNGGLIVAGEVSIALEDLQACALALADALEALEVIASCDAPGCTRCRDEAREALARLEGPGE